MSRVLVISPSTFGYEERITTAVSELGHEVRWHDERIGNDFFSKVLTRLRLLWLFPEYKDKHLSSIVDMVVDMDAEILLLINPETLVGKDLKKLKSISPDLIINIYKWDSIKQKPIDELTLKIADKIYSFDPEDCRANTSLTHLPLFHSHRDNKMAMGKKENSQYEFVFIGSAQWHRVKVLAKLIRALKKDDRNYFFYLVSQSAIHHIIYKIAAIIYGYQGELTKKALGYEEYLQMVEQSLCVVDVEYPNQSGLTMRSIEVLFSNSSIMTTNASIYEYKVSDVGGVFVFNESDCDIPDRTALGQCKDGQLFESYSIHSWVSSLIGGQGGVSWNGKRWV